MSDPTSERLTPLPPKPPAPVGYPVQAYSPYGAQPVYLVAQPKGLSVTALVLGLVSILFGFTFLVPLGALIFGILGLRREPAGRGMAITGIVIGSLFLLVWLVFGMVVIAVLIGSAASLSTIS